MYSEYLLEKDSEFIIPFERYCTCLCLYPRSWKLQNVESWMYTTCQLKRHLQKFCEKLHTPHKTISFYITIQSQFLIWRVYLCWIYWNQSGIVLLHNTHKTATTNKTVFSLAPWPFLPRTLSSASCWVIPVQELDRATHVATTNLASIYQKSNGALFQHLLLDSRLLKTSPRSLPLLEAYRSQVCTADDVLEEKECFKNRLRKNWATRFNRVVR